MTWPLTERTKKCLQLAWQEAQRLGLNYIGTEHVLIGLLKEGEGYAATVLKYAGIDLRRARLDLESLQRLELEKPPPSNSYVIVGPMETPPSARPNISVVHPRSNEGRALGKLLCEFAGVEFNRVKRIAVEFNFDSGEIPVFEIEKFAVKDTAAKTLNQFADQWPEMQGNVSSTVGQAPEA
jgi:ATP-dependent Clp protease ATP-binding subunit ClpA